ncbi:uncharacterized protein GGS25DRAFT_531127 [Hypoxylon fragiforme]|uniref:uncharacterized protein n=1 Tax=Hypoxylon fragiforme TaxID=63214 RepID=UPI0020C66B02|nr:uncharacterized protein GGS25DRAFT_531127 [Hypoxylon fragiforme]KAI2610222.1 hypothetical protein GGS25DRAFT_531127 [Hypoxylon fragiforme]
MSFSNDVSMDESQQPTIWGLSITFSIIAIVSVLLRFKARRIQGEQLESDDWTILVALILSMGVTVNLLMMTQCGGLGTHTRYDGDGNPLDPGRIVIFGKTTYSLEILVWPAVGMTKTSVLLLYKRIFITPRFRVVTWVGIGVAIAWTIAFTFALMFICHPIAARWNSEIPYTRGNYFALLAVALATDVATDALVLLLPVYKVWQLQMPITRKALVTGIFLLGSLVSIAGIIRTHFLAQVYDVLTEAPKVDVTWVYAPDFYWTIIETNVGVFSACAPTLRPIQELATRKLSSVIRKLSFPNLRSSDPPLDSLSSINKGDNIRLNSMEEGSSFDSKYISFTPEQLRNFLYV